MQAGAPLPLNAREQVEEIGHADIVVGIPSYNNAGTIGHVVRAINAGLAKYFPDRRGILVNSDGGSTDGTPELARNASVHDYQALCIAHPLFPIHRIITPYHGLPGKGSAIRTILGIARELGAKACAVVDADLRSITPEWMDLLLSPLLREGYDFTAPYYHRHKYDGTITNSIVYPLTRALYGRRVRQPIGGDFGISGRLAEHFLKQDVWHTDVARFGIDIWMTTTAIADGFRICQAFLGAKIHDAKDPAADLSAMLTQVVGSVFSLMDTHHAQWATIRGSHPVPLFGFEHAVGLEPVAVNTERMIARFAGAQAEMRSVWEMILAPSTLADIMALPTGPGGDFRYAADLWVRTVVDFGLAYHQGAMARHHILAALTPLYLARTASFVRETADSDARAVEENLEDLCLRFEKTKARLLEQWNTSGGIET